MNLKLVFGLGLAALLTMCGGCGPDASASSKYQFEVTIDPSPPRVGDARVLLAMTDADGVPVKGANVRVEGNMNHAGMKPSFAELEETAPGSYAGTLDFTMGGDWFILVSAKTSNGVLAEHKVDVPGVKSP